MIITPTFTAAVDSQFGANAAAFKAAFIVAAANFTSVYTDNIHINISVTAVAGTGTLGASDTTINSVGYTALRDALFNDKTSGDDITATGAGGSVPSTSADPVGATHTYWVTRAQAKALGLAADDLINDGTVTLGAGFAYDFDPSDGITGGQFDIVGVMMHEISEVMGRQGISGGTIGVDANSYTLLDLLSYTGAGARGLGSGAGNSFSIDNGTTLLKAFNASSGGDSRDWDSGTNDTFNAFSSPGVLNPLTAVDLRTMDAIGYDNAAPEPSTGILGVSALLLGGLIRRRFASPQ
jgi:hypothetical protein